MGHQGAGTAGGGNAAGAHSGGRARLLTESAARGQTTSSSRSPAPREGAEQFEFEAHPGKEPLPRHELVGGIAILQEDDPAGAEKILASRPSLHTAVFAKGEVSGEYRTRELAILAGKPTTRTEVTEHGHRFTVDLAGAYFSARLSTERQRILDQVQEGEVILDMFAGVGPFAITLAAKAALVVAADLNPQAIELMLENLAQNRAKNVLPVLADARRLSAVLPWKFDRIVMNLPLAGTEFLPDAFRLCRPGGTIHFYSLVSAGGEHACPDTGTGRDGALRTGSAVVLARAVACSV